MQRDNAIETFSQNYIESSQLPLEEATRKAQQVDYILRVSLARDTSKVPLYRKALMDPKAAVYNQLLRPLVAEMLDTLLNAAVNDGVIWSRLKTILLRKQKNLTKLKEDISDDGLRALINKSNEHEVPLDVIFEVYSRGAQDKTEKDGFNRINSFLAGGKARQLDADLLGETVVQELEEKKPTLSVVKRVLSEGKRK